MLNGTGERELVKVETALFGGGVNLMWAAHAKAGEESGRVAKVVPDGRTQGVELWGWFVGEEDGVGEHRVHES